MSPSPSPPPPADDDARPRSNVVNLRDVRGGRLLAEVEEVSETLLATLEARELGVDSVVARMALMTMLAGVWAVDLDVLHVDLDDEPAVARVLEPRIDVRRTGAVLGAKDLRDAAPDGAGA
jgi:hypothetical protein